MLLKKQKSDQKSVKNVSLNKYKNYNWSMLNVHEFSKWNIGKKNLVVKSVVGSILQFETFWLKYRKKLVVEPVVGSINDKADNFVQYCVCCAHALPRPTILKRGI